MRRLIYVLLMIIAILMVICYACLVVASKADDEALEEWYRRQHDVSED
jgi:hypothetical protein